MGTSAFFFFFFSLVQPFGPSTENEIVERSVGSNCQKALSLISCIGVISFLFGRNFLVNIILVIESRERNDL